MRSMIGERARQLSAYAVGEIDRARGKVNRASQLLARQLTGNFGARSLPSGSGPCRCSWAAASFRGTELSKIRKVRIGTAYAVVRSVSRSARSAEGSRTAPLAFGEQNVG